MKKCRKCGQVKRLDEFHTQKGMKDGHNSICKQCVLEHKKQYRLDNLEKVTAQNKKSYYNNRQKRLVSVRVWRESHKEHIIKHRKKMSRKIVLGRYGLTKSDFDKILMEQNGVCGICGEKETRVFQGKILPLHVDHCHKTNKIRGLLCNKCNNGIGRFNDNIDVMASAVSYLRQSG